MSWIISRYLWQIPSPRKPLLGCFQSLLDRKLNNHRISTTHFFFEGKLLQIPFQGNANANTNIELGTSDVLIVIVKTIRIILVRVYLTSHEVVFPKICIGYYTGQLQLMNPCILWKMDLRLVGSKRITAIKSGYWITYKFPGRSTADTGIMVNGRV